MECLNTHCRGRTLFLVDIQSQEERAMKSYDLIIKNAQIHTMDEDRKVYAKGIIGIE